MTPSIGRKRLVLLIAAVVVITVSVAPFVLQSHKKSRSTYIIGVPKRGEALFFGEKQCGICHSINGSGGRIAPDLTGNQPEAPAMGWLTAKVWNHGPGMWRQIRRNNKPFPDLNSQEMGDILSFLYKASNIDPPGNSETGRQVFVEKGCVRCHSVGTGGGKVAPELSRVANGDQTEWMSAMLNHAGSMVDPITSTLGEWPKFSGHEMNDLLAYINPVLPNAESKKNDYAKAGDTDRGALVFQERCAQCHSINGKDGGIGPGLGPERELPLSPARFASLMWNHAPAMLKRGHETNTPVSFLHGGQMKDLLAFLESVRYFEPSGSPLAGKDVFAKRGCAACHGYNAEGTQSGPRLKTNQEPFTAISFASALWRHGPQMIDRAEAMGRPWPKLEPQDIGELVSFLNDGTTGKKR